MCNQIQMLPLYSHHERVRESKAKVAQLVERHLAKVEVASSSLVFRSDAKNITDLSVDARVVELVDTLDLKSNGGNAVRVQVPPRVQKLNHLFGWAFFLSFF